ncbi:MAG: metallophosphoesterase [Tannerella sp.]|nr:metallophosphoesterase [Tannerella sp.]
MKICIIGLIIILLDSCAPFHTMRTGAGRTKKYEFTHNDIPQAFDNFKIIFLTDFHYQSLFTRKKLNKLIKTVNKSDADLILLGGDYHNDCCYVPELFDGISQLKSTHGTIAVMGNHDYAACYQEIVDHMNIYHIRLLEHQSDTIKLHNEQIIIAGVRNPFDLQTNGDAPTLDLSSDDFVILLTHTPDYIEDVPVTNTDLALAGHTHGGQITLFAIYAPVTRSKYGRRFRSGLKYNSEKTPIIISNGLGTSRKNIRLFAPSDIVQIKLRIEQSPK